MGRSPRAFRTGALADWDYIYRVVDRCRCAFDLSLRNSGVDCLMNDRFSRNYLSHVFRSRLVLTPPLLAHLR